MPAPDGATALRLATGDIAAAVLDVGLPDADGRDVCQAMRANGYLSPVIFLTAHHRFTDRLSGFSAGGDD
ncbi:DNA-binding response OmpR family regulator [Streptomyces canus]|uniref:DNA-binding response OmpR family regulator n=1 Tax=Streptomyces canus TaxID=58343 RepID=A0AAW8F8B0_9ACTN|nr:DNA-binding response OmpR family regulator [Streptomyces canus]MDQ0905063.1 DNA-binding response OmpR family regulator [Streptomyces canus]MDQ1064936.1 DNA-binding response OmpR family regulator [Streptomyces canus]